MKRYILGFIVCLITLLSHSQELIVLHQGNDSKSFNMSDIDSITHRANDVLNIYSNSQSESFSVMTVDSISIMKSEQTVNEINALIVANIEDPEILQINASDGSSWHFYGIKDEEGLTDSITHAEYITPEGNISIVQFDSKGRIISFVAPNNVEITFEWTNNDEAVVKIFNPEDNSYNFFNWIFNSIPSEARQITNTHLTPRKGKMKMQLLQDIINSPTFKVESNESNFYVLIRKCETPTNAKVFLRLYQMLYPGETEYKFGGEPYITTIYNYQFITTGWYEFKIPNLAFTKYKPNQLALEELEQAIIRIDEPLRNIFSGIAYIAENGGIMTAIESLSSYIGGLNPYVSTGVAAFEALIAAACEGGSNSENGILKRIYNDYEGSLKRYNPEWYYKEITKKIIIVPYVNGKPQKEVTMGVDGGDTIIELDGKPEIRSFSLTPSSPLAGEGYRAYVSYGCIPIGSKIVISVVGTDGYKDSTSQIVVSRDGKASLDVPGAAAGVQDVCSVKIYDPNGNEIASSVASLKFWNSHY